jgi:peptide/nickel transport system permease protein
VSTPPVDSLVLEHPLRATFAGERRGRGALRRRPGMILGFAILLAMVVCAVVPGLVAPDDPYQQDLSQRFLGPSTAHLFGTDDFGRDIFSRVVFGTRISIVTALAVVAASLLIGGIVGTIAGYRRGWVDEVLMRICDMFMAFPSILLPLIVVVVLGPSLVNTGIALAVRGWAPFARLMRGQVLTVKENAYVDAARALGAGHWRIVRRYIWPNATAPFIALAAIDLGFVILTAAGLGFLGLGAQPPTPEWGVMVAAGLQNLLISGWYAFFAGLTIAVAVLAFTLLGDGLQDWLDPRSLHRN